MTRRGSRVLACCLLPVTVAAAACANGENGAPVERPASVRVGAENVVVVRRDRIVVGPIISGELQAAQEATVRALLSGSVTQVAVEEGEAVRRGALLARIEAPQLEDAQQSAQSAVRAAENQVEVARREAARTEELVEAGALAARDLDVARQSVTAAEAQLADARARLVAAGQQLADTVLRAPLAGLVADRAVNVGDVVSPGTAMVTIIDPSSMRLEASVPSEQIAQLRVGASVMFDVRGYDQRFEGRIERISPKADPVTRQVPIFVSIPNSGGRLLAGLYAEGRVVVDSAEGLVVPINAVNSGDEPPWVLRVADGRAERVAVTVGLRDNRTERLQVIGGLSEGDVLLRGAAQGITPGTPVDTGAPAAAAAGGTPPARD